MDAGSIQRQDHPLKLRPQIAAQCGIQFFNVAAKDSCLSGGKKRVTHNPLSLLRRQMAAARADNQHVAIFCSHRIHQCGIGLNAYCKTIGCKRHACIQCSGQVIGNDKQLVLQFHHVPAVFNPCKNIIMTENLKWNSPNVSYRNMLAFLTTRLGIIVVSETLVNNLSCDI